MPTPAKALFTLRDLLAEQLRDLYDAETQYASSLPQMVEKAGVSELQVCLSTILEQTRQNIILLEEACGELDVPAHGVPCEAMRGLVREAKDTASVWGDRATIDAAIIGNAQRIVHYEIAGFGTTKAFASCLKLPRLVAILSDLVNQAFANDLTLTRIATGGWFSAGINQEAAEASPAVAAE
jgi:ferritin-like metal-binding protein YciE